MSASIHSIGFAALTPWEIFTPSATRDAVELEHDLRKLYERFEPHRPTLNSLWERVNRLLTWGTAWPECDAPPPSPTTIDRTHRWITDLYTEVLDSGRTWDDPLITANREGEAMFEWQHGERRLTIYVTEAEVNYSKTWGTPPDFQFEDGTTDTPEIRETLWAWLGG